MIPWLLWYFCTLWLKGSCIWSLLLSIWVDIHISTNTGSHKANITCPILQRPQCLQSTNTALGRKKKWSDPKSSPHHCLPYALHANMVINFHEKHQYFNQYLLHHQLSPNREKIWPTTLMLLPDLLQGSKCAMTNPSNPAVVPTSHCPPCNCHCLLTKGYNNAILMSLIVGFARLFLETDYPGAISPRYNQLHCKNYLPCPRIWTLQMAGGFWQHAPAIPSFLW